MQYGYFNDQQREYIITRPDTPLPWINYIGCENYYGLISNTAGGYSFYRDARLRRLTRYRYNQVPTDTGGRYIYLRDEQTGEYWSPTWQPTRTELTDYSCRHGLGYTIIQSTHRGIQANLTFFVPLGENLEVWRLELTNLRSQAAELDIFSCAEFCLWDALDDSSNYQRNLNIGEVEVEDNVIYHKTEYRERRDHFAFFACSEAVSGYETQRELFLGRYRGWDTPIVVEQGQSQNSIAHGWSPIGSHQIKQTLVPDETHQTIFLLGYHENPRDDKFDPPGSQRINKRTVIPIIKTYLNTRQVELAFQELRNYWSSLLDVFQVHTPDEHTNRMVNIWNSYQCMVTFNMSRSASYFETGVGRGMGFRDSNQDILGFVHMVPDRARQRILDLAATQLQNGGAYHQFQPMTKRGNDAAGSNFNDDPLWLIMSTAAYLKETNDWLLLDELVPFESSPGSEAPLIKHLQRSIAYTLDRLGTHGLPLIGRADWNDCLNLNTFSQDPGESFQTTNNQDGKVAESIFIAGLFVLAVKEMEEIAVRLGRDDDAATYHEYGHLMEKAVLEHGWDGEWFLRAYDHFGNTVGSSTCQEGRIFIEPQGICTMAGIGISDGKVAHALDAVKTRLATPHGIVLQQPAYSSYYLHLGEISSYPPGYKENAGIFCHTNPWIMIAETRRGDGDQAFDYYIRINPSAREQISDLHRCEPYVYAQMIAGKDAVNFGEAKNSWLTGTAAWNYIAITQWILGIRPSYDGLVVEPVIPKSWHGFIARRQFHGVTYNISVERHGLGNHVLLLVDDSPIHSTTIPHPPAGVQEVFVKAEIR